MYLIGLEYRRDEFFGPDSQSFLSQFASLHNRELAVTVGVEKMKMFGRLWRQQTLKSYAFGRQVQL